MGVLRMHHVGVVVEDLALVRDFLLAIGLELEGEDVVAGDWVGEVIGLPDVRSEVAMLRTPDGHARIELSRFIAPVSPALPYPAPSHMPGLRHLAFPVDDLAATLATVRRLGYDTVGSVQRYEDVYELCYVRGPEGLIVELAEEL